MTGNRLLDLVRLEGQKVGISLIDGSRMDDCHLVFAGRDRVWVYVNGHDEFVSSTTVSDFWETY